MPRKKKASLKGRGKWSHLDWTVVLHRRAPITIIRQQARTLKDLASFLLNMGIDEEDVMGVLRSTTKAQAIVTGLAVKRFMRK